MGSILLDGILHVIITRDIGRRNHEQLNMAMAIKEIVPPALPLSHILSICLSQCDFSCLSSGVVICTVLHHGKSMLDCTLHAFNGCPRSSVLEGGIDSPLTLGR